ncbi:hypothetical protein FT663_01793 [Candidozyma haemuli var. vulneris]|uniref:Uncharacterized protein n=1 Tax=Candidozyma haemuli TaxID=45357 RepID=A0A2V1AYH0_9ASCO|nr:hypothetical protein CXQ85_002868 [[Candida] haemuloni]KAF3991084.1 hypothetical protein FT662_01912 [[Candida] haemuloni var. vulneris]KAF3993625.1 hypothetical protein FT663_01793 [[Candida] haemuloni var. vulneris]PVH23140.1 hypothetical protein CXQ85_002868 [[Candida] haemuloni]
MLTQLALPLSALHLWFPLLLSAKALNRPPGENIQFLLHYWLWYLGLSYVHFYLASMVPLQGVVDLFLAGVKIWLFYGHGCIVLSRFYLPRVAFATTGWTSVVELEATVIDPLVSAFVVRNPILQNTMSVIERTGIASFASALFAFNHELCRSVSWPKRPSCLHLGVDFLCYMDSPRELAARLQKLERFIFGIRSAVSPVVSPKSRKVSSRKLNTSKVDYDDSFSPRSTEFYTPNRSNALSPAVFSPVAGPLETNSPLVKKTRRRPPEETKRTRSASVGSIDDSPLPYPLEDPNPTERSVSEVIFKSRRDL